jgi:DNA-binding MarR family transcriptional regulator
MFESEDNIHELQDTLRGVSGDGIDGLPGVGGDQVQRLRRPGGDHVDRVLLQWADVRPDLDTAPVRVIARLGRVTAYIDAGVNARLGEFGLTREAWDVLASLRRAGPPHRLSPTQLYLGLMRTSGAMTHRLSGLERAGLVRRVPNPQDGRGLFVELTRKGISLVDRVAPGHLANERSLLAGLSEREQDALADLLRKLLRGFEREHPAPPPNGRGGRRKSRPRGSSTA